MIKIFAFVGLLAVALSFVPVPFKPDFGYVHDAFVCNYLGTVCRDKMSVLPVAWQRYTP